MTGKYKLTGLTAGNTNSRTVTITDGAGQTITNTKTDVATKLYVYNRYTVCWYNVPYWCMADSARTSVCSTGSACCSCVLWTFSGGSFKTYFCAKSSGLRIGDKDYGWQYQGDTSGPNMGFHLNLRRLCAGVYATTTSGFRGFVVCASSDSWEVYYSWNASGGDLIINRICLRGSLV